MQSIENTDTPFQSNCVVLSGGGIRCIEMLGVLQAAMDKSLIHLHEIDVWIGTSAGSIVSFLCLLGWNPVESLVEIVRQRQTLNQIRDSFQLSKVLSEEDGPISFDLIEDLLEQTALQKIHENELTFERFYELTQKKFVCVTYNYSKHEPCYLSVDTVPHMKVTKAIRMSCAIPLLFQKTTYNGDWYIDGAVCDNLAIDYAFNTYPNVNPFVINVHQSYIEDTNSQPGWSKFALLYNLYKIMLNTSSTTKLNQYKGRLYVVHVKGKNKVKFWSMMYDPVTLLEMFSDGYLTI